MAILKINKLIFWLYNNIHNYETPLSKIYPIYQKVTQTKKVFKNITNYIKIDAY